MTASFLYVIGPAGYKRPVKIGFAGNLLKRLRGLQTGNHRRLEVKHWFAFESREDAAFAEVRCHEYFKDRMIVGEWFAITAKEAAEMIRLMCKQRYSDAG